MIYSALPNVAVFSSPPPKLCIVPHLQFVPRILTEEDRRFLKQKIKCSLETLFTYFTSLQIYAFRFTL
jgi:hypothetical protein